jgi:tripartite-type tricarboxylate transporter receptor subunit TctC
VTIERRSFNGAMALLLAMSAVTGWSAHAADYPTRPVTIITPAPAGSGPDVIVRIVADRLGRIWRQQVVIANRPGAGGLIGMQAAAAVKPDGYTLYMPLGSTFFVLPELHPKLPLDLQRDIVPIGIVGEQPMVIAVNPKLGVNNLPELIALAKQHPETILYGANKGSLPNLTGEVLQQRAGIKLTYVPYGNTAKATQDTVGGTLQLVIESLSGLAGPIKAGMLKPLAVASAKRVPDYPDLPTVAEAVPPMGVFEARGWFALTAPRGTPDAIVRKVSADLRAVLSQSELRTRFAALGTYARPMSPAAAADFIRNEQALWRPIVRRVVLFSH